MNIRQIIGSFLIATSLVTLFYIYYPLYQLLLPSQPPLSLTNSPAAFINIPSISAWATLIEDVDPWNKEAYLTALNQGVAVASGSAPIGSREPIFLFAHSSQEPWQITRNNVVFFRLGELQPGSDIILGKDYRQYRYRVTGLKEVSPSEVTYLTDPQAPLTLMTCTPIGTSWKRLLVFAEPI